MPYTLKKNKFKYKNPDTGNYEGVDVVAERSFADYQSALETVGLQQQTVVRSEGTTQKNAVTAAGTAAAANFPATAAACDTLAGDFAATYVPDQAYAVGDYCTYQYQLYQCKTAIAVNTDHTFVTSHWNLITVTDTINDQVDDLKTQLYLIVPEYDATVAYDSGEFVIRNNKIYRRNPRTAAPTPESWTGGHWVQIASLSAELPGKATNELIANAYSPTNSYNKGDIIIRSNHLYQAKNNVSAETWTGGHWNDLGKVTTYIQNAITQAITQAIAPNATAEVINYKSWNINIERFNNIVYYEKLFNGETLNPNNSAPLMEKDYSIKFQNNPYSVHFKTDASNTSTDVRITVPTAFKLLGTQEFEVTMYISNAANITNMSFRTLSSGMVKTPDVTPQTGWNKFRFFLTGAGTYDVDTDTTTIRLVINHSEGTDIDIYVGSITQIKPAQGNLIIVEDAGYYSFYENAYTTLKNINVPVTWGLSFNFDAEDATDRTLLKESELELIAMDGLSEFSFRNSNNVGIDFRNDTTPYPAQADTIKCIRLLEKYNITPAKIFRSVWPFNISPYPELANLEVDASVSYDGSAGNSYIPFRNRYNIPRYGLDNQTESWVDARFKALKEQHCTIFIYLHGIGTGSSTTSSDLFSYFVGKVSEGISEGWLNCTTYNRLMAYYSKIS